MPRCFEADFHQVLTLPQHIGSNIIPLLLKDKCLQYKTGRALTPGLFLLCQLSEKSEILFNRGNGVTVLSPCIFIITQSGRTILTVGDGGNAGRSYALSN